MAHAALGRCHGLSHAKPDATTHTALDKKKSFVQFNLF